MTAPHAPDYRHGYLRIPLQVWGDLFCRAPLTRRQLQLVAQVIRESWGWATQGGGVYLWTRPLTPRHFAETTGLSTDRISRDLRQLVARGVLREQERRYQLVPDPRLWISGKEPAPEPRSQPPKGPAATVETALSAPVLKKAKTGNRNVHRPTRSELPPAGDNPLSAPLSMPLSSGGQRSAPGATALRKPLALADRGVRIITAFVPLSFHERGTLRRWIMEDGIAAVWHAFDPLLRQRPPDGAALKARLALRSSVLTNEEGEDREEPQPLVPPWKEE